MRQAAKRRLSLQVPYGVPRALANPKGLRILEWDEASTRVAPSS